MHHALQIQEILLNIFGHCRLPSTERTRSDLPALARTCRVFKEPALDVLWETLPDPSPLARCLPEASYDRQISPWNKRYSFHRSLTQMEWVILRSYTRRIRCIQDYYRGLDWESVGTFLNPPTTEPLFPNLRHLCCDSETENILSFHTPFRSLISLALEFMDEADLYALQGSLESLSKFSPNIRRLSTNLHRPDITFSNFLSRCICRWRNLHTVFLGDTTLDLDALTHLSRVPSLTQLTFTLSATLLHQITSSDSPLLFTNLHELTLYSEFLDPISRLLSWTQLPVITEFRAFVENCSSKLDVFTFSVSIQTSSIGRTIQGLSLYQWIPSGAPHVAEHPRLVLGFEDFRPCMAFGNLRRINFDIGCDVNLTSSGLLALVLAWPHLEHLHINKDWGWNTAGGITPDGLLQLLQTCRSLSRIALTIDTRGYTELPQSPASLGLTLPSTLSIDAGDSIIEEESVPAIAAFFVGIAHRSDLFFRAWSGWSMKETSVYTLRWHDVYRWVDGAVSQRSLTLFWVPLF